MRDQEGWYFRKTLNFGPTTITVELNAHDTQQVKLKIIDTERTGGIAVLVDQFFRVAKRLNAKTKLDVKRNPATLLIMPKGKVDAEAWKAEIIDALTDAEMQYATKHSKVLENFRADDVTAKINPVAERLMFEGILRDMQLPTWTEKVENRTKKRGRSAEGSFPFISRRVETAFAKILEATFANMDLPLPEGYATIIGKFLAVSIMGKMPPHAEITKDKFEELTVKAIESLKISGAYLDDDRMARLKYYDHNIAENTWEALMEPSRNIGDIISKPRVSDPSNPTEPLIPTGPSGPTRW